MKYLEYSNKIFRIQLWGLKKRKDKKKISIFKMLKKMKKKNPNNMLTNI